MPDPAAFVAGEFGRTPVHHARTDAGAFADLLSLDAVDRILTTMSLRSPAFRLVQDGVTLPAARYTRSGRIGSRPLSDLIDVGRVHALFDAGATVVLQGLQRYWEPVATFCRDLERTLGHAVQANAYLTPPSAAGLNLHADSHDVFALQTHGRKRWVVHPPRYPEDAADPHPWDLTLEPGDALYLPTGTRHAAQTVAEPSLHLTIGVRTTTVGDLVRRAIRSLGADLDEPLPAGWHRDPDVLATTLDRALADVGRELDATDGNTLAHEAAERFLGRLVPPLRGHLVDLVELDTVDDTTRFVRRPGTVARVVDEDTRVVLVLGDRRVSLPAPAGPALRAVLQREHVRAEDLDGLLAPDSRLVLLRRLVREGLLAIDRG